MKAHATSSGAPASWQSELATAVRDPADLLRLLELPTELLADARRAASAFGLRVPHAFIARMRKGDPRDPLLLQVLPLGLELQSGARFTADPVGDLAAMKSPGLLHKYHGRVLLVTTGACAVHCRYCFRREFPYSEANAAAERWEPALDHIAADPSISEVILSGGDPLTLPDAKLGELIARLESIPHLRRLRIHTRLPIVLPSRVTTSLLDLLHATRLAPVVVLHANHANEFDAATGAAAASLHSVCAALLNQSVLLRGVNDSVDALVQLSETLFSHGIAPYYLHRLDRVTGAAHFDLSDREARELLHGLQSRLPGYLVPRLVRELAGAPYKCPEPPSE
jgi:EF-P beta-lysylation protein EpmB